MDNLPNEFKALTLQKQPFEGSTFTIAPVQNELLLWSGRHIVKGDQPIDGPNGCEIKRVVPQGEALVVLGSDGKIYRRDPESQAWGDVLPKSKGTVEEKFYTLSDGRVAWVTTKNHHLAVLDVSGRARKFEKVKLGDKEAITTIESLTNSHILAGTSNGHVIEWDQEGRHIQTRRPVVAKKNWRCRIERIQQLGESVVVQSPKKLQICALNLTKLKEMERVSLVASRQCFAENKLLVCRMDEVFGEGPKGPLGIWDLDSNALIPLDDKEFYYHPQAMIRKDLRIVGGEPMKPLKAWDLNGTALSTFGKISAPGRLYKDDGLFEVEGRVFSRSGSNAIGCISDSGTTVFGCPQDETITSFTVAQGELWVSTHKGNLFSASL